MPNYANGAIRGIGKSGDDYLVLSALTNYDATQDDVIREIRRSVWINAFCPPAARSASIEYWWHYTINDDPQSGWDITFCVYYYKAPNQGFIRKDI